jgi:hypothetical protein
MAYMTGYIPVGSYAPNRLANVGIGHGAIDGGGALTYLNAETGTEFSATLGFTGNFENTRRICQRGRLAPQPRRCAVPSSFLSARSGISTSS